MDTFYVHCAHSCKVTAPQIQSLEMRAKSVQGFQNNNKKSFMIEKYLKSDNMVTIYMKTLLDYPLVLPAINYV